MDLISLKDELGLLHARGESERVMECVRGHESTFDGLRPSPYLGSIYRYMMLACYREKEYDAGDMWWRRALEQYRLCAYSRGVALMLITPLFKLLHVMDPPPGSPPKSDIIERATLMLAECMKTLVELSQSESYDEDPIDGVMAYRQAAEKYAYCLYRVGRHLEAADTYQDVLEYLLQSDAQHNVSFQRSEMKLRGGAALSLYTNDADQFRDHFIDTLKYIADHPSSESRLAEIRRIAKSNIDVLKNNRNHDVSNLEHFEIP